MIILYQPKEILIIMNYSSYFDIHNLDRFFLDISVPIIEWLHGSSNIRLLESAFHSTCYANRLFASNSRSNPSLALTDDTQEQIFELTQHFLYTLDLLSAYAAYDYPKKMYDPEINSALKEYVEHLLHCIDLNNFDEAMIHAHVSQDFRDEYKNNLHLLFAKSMELPAAEKSLLYWKDAIPDLLLQKALLNLRYSYITIL